MDLSRDFPKITHITYSFDFSHHSPRRMTKRDLLKCAPIVAKTATDTHPLMSLPPTPPLMTDVTHVLHIHISAKAIPPSPLSMQLPAVKPRSMEVKEKEYISKE